MCIRDRLNLGTDLLKGGLDLVGFFLVHAFLDRLGSGLDQVLGFLQPEASERPDFLNDLDLLVAGRREHDREFGLLFGRRGTRAGRARSHCHRGSRRHAPLLFEHLGEVSRLEDGELRQIVNNLGQISH